MSNNALTNFSFAGNPSTNAAKLKALAHGGPLVVAIDHRLHAMMPEAFNDAANAGKTVLMADFEAMVMDAMLIDTEVTKDGDAENPAYLIKQEDGDEVLKRGSELSEQD